jgi:hypothetical protein
VSWPGSVVESHSWGGALVMIAKNGTSTLVARVNVPFLAIIQGAGRASEQDRRFGFKNRAERG